MQGADNNLILGFDQPMNSSYFEKVAGEVRALFGGVKLVLRASGTEPKVRIYIEGEDAGEIEEAMRHTAWQISDFV